MHFSTRIRALALKLATGTSATVLLFSGTAGTVQAATTFDPASAEIQLYQLTNVDRASAGKAPLAFNPTLSAMARDGQMTICGMTVNGRSRDMLDRNYFSHQIPPCGDYVWGPAGSPQSGALAASGVQWTAAGENIAWNQLSVQSDSVIGANTQFINSPPHYANIIGDYNQVGVGAWSSGGKTMYTEIFIQGPPAPGVVVIPPGGGTTPSGGHFESLPPARILDTRDGTGAGGHAAPVGAGQVIDVPVLGQGGVPATGVSAVWLNVTAVSPTAWSFLTVYPSGVGRPTASNLNFTAGHTVPNLVEVAPGSNGAVSVYNFAGNVDVVVDVAGYVAQSAGTEGLYNALAPSRITDTRAGSGQANAGNTVAPGQSLVVQVAGMGGVPATGAGAVVMNVTAVSPSSGGFLTVYPGGSSVPTASNLNFGAGQTVANRVAAKLSPDGKVSIFNASGATDVIVDVNGWYSDASGTGGALFTPASTPTRVADTRGSGGPVQGGNSLALVLASTAGIPAGARAVVLNLTATDTTAAGGFITAYPAGGSVPTASDLNFGPGTTVPNLVVVTLGPGGAADFYNFNGSTNIIIDVLGWYQ
ncbi:MAG: CAP domain-containing protein [Candidatus Dormibacteria bacterium]